VAARAAPASSAAARAAPAASRPSAVRPADDGYRAQALLDGQAASGAGARTVVQVGAYGEADKLREARQKLEKLGLKTYTQVVEVDGAKRTRVRVGPFASRAEADKAAARIKAAGLPAAVLTL
jgi:DedD protein